MTLAFIITAVVAGILFFLWISGRDRLTEAEEKILQQDKHIQELRTNPERIIRPRQTELTMEMIHDVIRDNGFVPHQDEEGWVSFKKQGEVYLIGVRNFPHIQFYKGYTFENDYDMDILKQAAKMVMDEVWHGRITHVEGSRSIAYREFGIEKSLEHFCESFNDYMHMMDELINCHIFFYNKLMEEKKEQNRDTLLISNPDKPKTIMS